MVLTQKKYPVMNKRNGSNSKIMAHVPPSSSATAIVPTASSTSLRTLLVRPSIGLLLSIAYGYGVENKVLFSERELMRSGAMFASLFTSNMVGNSIMPHGMVSKTTDGIRQVESMVVEPLMSGVLFAGMNYFLIDGDYNQTANHLIRGAVVDFGAGVSEGVVTPYIPF